MRDPARSNREPQHGVEYTNRATIRCLFPKKPLQGWRGTTGCSPSPLNLSPQSVTGRGVTRKAMSEHGGQVVVVLLVYSVDLVWKKEDFFMKNTRPGLAPLVIERVKPQPPFVSMTATSSVHPAFTFIISADTFPADALGVRIAQNDKVLAGLSISLEDAVTMAHEIIHYAESAYAEGDE